MYSESDADDIYAVAATDGDNSGIMLTYFTNDEGATERQIALSIFGGENSYKLILLDDAHDAEETDILHPEDGKIFFTMQPNTVVYLKNA